MIERRPVELAAGSASPTGLPVVEYVVASKRGHCFLQRQVATEASRRMIFAGSSPVRQTAVVIRCP